MDITGAQWHEGEDQMHKILHVPPQGNPTRPGLSPHAQRLLHLSSLLAVGLVDDQGRPWTTVLGGEPGFARSLGQSIVGVRVLADAKYDPVIEALSVKNRAIEGVSDQAKATDFAALGLHLASRDRVKLHGKIVASDIADGDDHVAQVQAAFLVTGSLGTSLRCSIHMENEPP